MKNRLNRRGRFVRLAVSLICILCCVLLCAGCGLKKPLFGFGKPADLVLPAPQTSETSGSSSPESTSPESTSPESTSPETSASSSSEASGSPSQAPIQSSGTAEDYDGFLPAPKLTWLDELDIPEWSGRPYVEQNGNVPFFDTDNLKPESYEIYYDLDSLGRCTLAEAVVGPDTQPTQKRGNIGMIHPTGWHKERYSFVDGEALYNRCHLIAYYLTAENANPRNLVTGTSYMNRQGMNDFENLVGDYIKETGNHVRYRVTPVWTGDNLLCDGLLVEGWSIEDEGEDICFCIYAYNVQPGVHIDYRTGDNYAENGEEAVTAANQQKKEDELPLTEEDIIGTYVLNKKSMKFHRPDCEGAINMAAKNREEYTGSRKELLLDGYTPCPVCLP